VIVANVVKDAGEGTSNARHARSFFPVKTRHRIPGKIFLPAAHAVRETNRPDEAITAMR
jgi:hypothetical protein